MEETANVLETASLLSGYSTGTASLLDGPSHLQVQYTPLSEVFSSHGEPLPDGRGPQSSNSEAMIRALKALQDKIRMLEMERRTAADKFRKLSEDTQRHAAVQGANSEESSPRYRETRQRLHTLDRQFTAQVQEMDQMREKLRLAESDRLKLMERNHTLEQRQRELLARQQWMQHQESEGNLRKATTQDPPVTDRHRHPQPPDSDADRRLRQLEFEQARLKSLHSATANKVRNLEGQLVGSEPGRRRLVEVPGESLPTKRTSKSGTSLKNLKEQPVAFPRKPAHYLPVPGIHYHLNMKDVPFVVGKSTTPSHSLVANYQRVIALMKYHNPVICGAAAANIAAGRSRSARKADKKKGKGRPLAPSGTTEEEVQGLLSVLEDEFGRMTFEHQELARLIQEQADPGDPAATADLEAELSCVVDRLESKLEQIQVVKSMLSGMRHRGRERHHHVAPGGGKIAAAKKHASSKNTAAAAATSSSSSIGSQASLEMLRKMKTVQQKLERDDLSWD